MIQTQVCELCKAQGIAKLIPPSQAKAHKMKMHVTAPSAQAPSPAAVAAPKRRGRPPKNDAAMTAAERKAASRNNQKIADILNESDSKGRLHNERSGEAEQSGGQSELERIIQGRQHDITKIAPPWWSSPENILIEGGESDLAEEDAQLAFENTKKMAGFRVEPEGAGPDTDDDPTADTNIGVEKPGKRSWVRVVTTEDKWVAVTIHYIITTLPSWVGVQWADLPEAKCPFCSEIFLTPLGMESHLEIKYKEGKTDLKKHEEFIEASAAFNTVQLPGHMLSVYAEPQTVPYIHYREISSVMEKIRKAVRKKPGRIS